MPLKQISKEHKKLLGLSENDTVFLKEEWDKLTPEERAEYGTPIQGVMSPAQRTMMGLDKGANANSSSGNVTDDTNYYELTKAQRDDLWENNRPFYGLLFWLEFARYPRNVERPDILDIDDLLNTYRKDKLPGLRKMSYTELRKAGYLNRLRNLDVEAYNKALMIDDEDTNNDEAGATSNLNTGNSITANKTNVSNHSDFSNLSVGQKNELYQNDRPLYNALHFLQFGKYPAGIESVELSEANIRLAEIKKAELNTFDSLSWEELRKLNKLGRLANMDIAMYNRKMME